MGAITYDIKITDEMMLDVKRQVVEEQIKKYNEQFCDKTGDLNNSLSYVEKDGKFYIFNGIKQIDVI